MVCANEPSSGQVNCILFSQVCTHDLKFDINCFVLDKHVSESEKEKDDPEEDKNDEDILESENDL